MHAFMSKVNKAAQLNVIFLFRMSKVTYNLLDFLTPPRRTTCDVLQKLLLVKLMYVGKRAGLKNLTGGPPLTTFVASLFK